MFEVRVSEKEFSTVVMPYLGDTGIKSHLDSNGEVVIVKGEVTPTQEKELREKLELFREDPGLFCRIENGM